MKLSLKIIPPLTRGDYRVIADCLDAYARDRMKEVEAMKPSEARTMISFEAGMAKGLCFRIRVALEKGGQS